MGRLAEHDDAAVAEALDEIAELVQIAERLGGLCHSLLMRVRIVSARFAGTSSPSAKPEGAASTLLTLARSGSAQPSSPISGTKATAPKSFSSNLFSLVRRTSTIV